MHSIYFLVLLEIKEFKIQYSVWIIKGLDNGDLDNQGPTVSCLFILQYVATVQI